MDYAKVMMGENAVHLPFNFVRIDMGNVNMILGQDVSRQLTFDAKASFSIVKGDMIFRPHLVIESNHPKGMGAAAIITSSSFCDLSEWEHHGNTLLDLRKNT